MGSNADDANEPNKDADQASKWLRFVERFTKLGAKHANQLPTGRREGKSSFWRFVAVWVGLLLPLCIGIFSRATEADTREVAEMLYNSNPPVAWGVIFMLALISVAVAGFQAHSHTKVSYGDCMVIGIKWSGYFVIFLLLIMPIVRAFVKFAVRSLS